MLQAAETIYFSTVKGRRHRTPPAQLLLQEDLLVVRQLHTNTNSLES